AKTGIATLWHRRRAGMRLLAGQRYFQPPQPLPMGDNTDIDALILQNRPLLDVKLEKCVDLAGADFLIALPANALQFIAEALAILILAGIGPIEIMLAN